MCSPIVAGAASSDRQKTMADGTSDLAHFWMLRRPMKSLIKIDMNSVECSPISYLYLSYISACTSPKISVSDSSTICISTACAASYSFSLAASAAFLSFIGSTVDGGLEGIIFSAFFMTIEIISPNTLKLIDSCFRRSSSHQQASLSK